MPEIPAVGPKISDSKHRCLFCTACHWRTQLTVCLITNTHQCEFLLQGICLLGPLFRDVRDIRDSDHNSDTTISGRIVVRPCLATRCIATILNSNTNHCMYHPPTTQWYWLYCIRKVVSSSFPSEIARGFITRVRHALYFADQFFLFLRRQVVEARDRRSVMVTTPTSVKSFMLKLVELLHKLDISRLSRAEVREDDSGAAGGIR